MELPDLGVIVGVRTPSVDGGDPSPPALVYIPGAALRGLEIVPIAKKSANVEEVDPLGTGPKEGFPQDEEDPFGF